MNYENTASIGREIEQDVMAERITTEETPLKLATETRKTKKPKASKNKLMDAEWEKLKEIVPGYGFFQEMPEGTIDEIASAYNKNRSESLTHRA